MVFCQTLDFTEQEQSLIAQVGAVYGLTIAETAEKMFQGGIERRTKKGPQRGQNVLFFRRKDDQTENVYELYEQGKRHLFEANLDCEEYEIAVKKLAESLGI